MPLEHSTGKRKESFEGKLIIAGFILVLLGVFLPYLRGEEVIESYYRDAVLVRPEESDSKLYELDARIETTSTWGFWFLIKNSEYQINSITWPNGGTVQLECAEFYFDQYNKNRCSAHDGDEVYSIELRNPSSLRAREVK